MNQSTAVTPQRYIKVVDADVIVAQQHEPALRSLLAEASITPELDETSELLGLTKLTITDIDRARNRLLPNGRLKRPDDEQEQEALTAWEAAHPLPRSKSALDQVLWAVRATFASRFAGWTPTLGKNRFVGKVLGVGEVIHTGPPEPPMATSDKPFFAQPRAAEPGRGVKVGVLDTSVYNHPWLAGGWTASSSDTVSEDTAPPFAQGHATFVTGLILRHAPGATVAVRSVLDEHGAATSWEVAKAIVEFGQSGLDVLNLSFACYTEDGEAPLVLATAINRLDPDLIVVAAAGNHGRADQEPDFTTADTRKAAWPAAIDRVIGVGAADDRGTPADFTPHALWVDVTAPGVDLTSTYLKKATDDGGGEVPFVDGFARWSGTSFAAALVTGAIAARVQHGTTTARQALESLIRDAAGTESSTPPPPPFLPLWPPHPGSGTESSGRQRS